MAHIPIIIVAIGVCVTAAIAKAEGAPLHIAWDPSPNRDVAGYRVYVGTESRVYTASYDVGPRTWFIYTGLAGRWYYFAVAAYLPGPVVGPLSDEISAFASDTSVVDAAALRATAAPGTISAGTADLAHQVVCADSPVRVCFDAIPVASAPGEVTSLTLLPDGRLLFIEAARRVRILARDELLADPALVVTPEGRLTHMAVDPAFPATGHVFIGIARNGTAGFWMDIVRFRLVENQLGEPAVVVAGLPLDESPAPFVFDPQQRLYVALPAEAGSGTANRNAFSGKVLRLNIDGTVPSDNPTASPVLAHGYARPIALEWDATRQRLWLSGLDTRFPEPVAYVDLGLAEPREWPRVPRPSSIGPSATPTFGPGTLAVALRTSSAPTLVLFPIDRDGLRPIDSREHSASELMPLRLGSLGIPTGVAVGQEFPPYIAVRSPSAMHGSDTFTILVLQPRR